MIPPGRSLACLILLSTLLFCSVGKAETALIVSLGDSDTAGFGVGRENAFPARLEAKCRCPS